MARTNVTAQPGVWTFTVSLRPHYWPLPPQYSNWPDYADCSVDRVQVGVYPWWFAIERGMYASTSRHWILYAMMYDTNIASADLVQLGDEVLIDHDELYTFQLQIAAPNLYIDRTAALPMGTLLARSRTIIDTWAMEDGEVTLSAQGFGSASWEYEKGSFYPPPYELPNLSNIHTLFEFNGNPNVVTESVETLKIVTSASSFDGFSGTFGRWTTAGWPYISENPENWTWTGEGDTLTLQHAAWDNGPASGPGFNETWMGGLSLQASGKSWMFNPSKIRVTRQGRGQRYPEDQPTEFNRALIWCGFKKQDWLPFTVPPREDTERPTGEFEDGDSVPCYLEELVAAGDYVGSDWGMHSDFNPPETWELGPDSLMHAPAIWTGPDITAHVDKKWLIDNGYYVEQNEGKEGLLDLSTDMDLVIDADVLSATDFVSDPWKQVTVELDEEVDVDLSGEIGSRVSAWTGDYITNDSGAEGTSGAVTLLVPAATAATISRTLKTNFDAQIAWVKANSASPELPTVYNCLKQNYARCSGGGPWSDEDVCCWNYAWVKLVYTAPETVSESDTLTLKCSYQSFAVTDSHVTSSVRVSGDVGEGFPPFEVTLTSEETLSWTIRDSEPGVNTKYLCLMLPTSGRIQADLALVRSLELKFPAQAEEAEWELNGLSLCLDPEATDHLHLKFAEDWRKGSSGGFRGRIDQNPRGVLNREAYACWEAEPIISTVERLTGVASGEDLSYMRSLRAYLEMLSAAGNGVKLSLSDQQWEDYYADGDGAACDLETIATGYPEEARIAQRCGKLVMVPNLKYKPRIWQALGGGAEGLLYQSAAPKRNTSDAVTVKRAETDAGPWSEIESLTTREDGEYTGGLYVEAYDYTTEMEGDVTLWTPIKYVWVVGRHNLGDMYRRQLHLRSEFGGTRRRGGVWMHKGPTGVPWVAYIKGDNICLRQQSAMPATFGSEIIVDTSGTYDAVKCEGDDRLLWVVAHHADNDNTYIWYSDDQGATWTGPTLISS